MRFNRKIKRFFFNRYKHIEVYFPITKSNLITYFTNKITGKIYSRNKLLSINFIITSQAEIRIFAPILNYLIDNTFKVNINLFYAKRDLIFDLDLERKIKNTDAVNIQSSPFYLASSSNSVNLICLDHQYHKISHKAGIAIINFINTKKFKTVCLQHGGNQDDYIKGQLTSKSIYQIVFGQLIYNRFLEYGYNKTDVFLTGNPLHDKWLKRKQSLDLKDSRKVISLITCMHTEYDNKTNPEACYIEYLQNIYNSINFEECILVIKMHPYDSLNNNLYKRVMLDLCMSKNDIKIITPNSTDVTVYDLISGSDLVISRASTIIEEALMMKKNVLAYDLFEDGNSMYYDFLLRYRSYTKIVKSTMLLKSAISKYLEKPFYNEGDIEDLIKNVTYKLDGKSTSRIVDVIKTISRLN